MDKNRENIFFLFEARFFRYFKTIVKKIVIYFFFSFLFVTLRKHAFFFSV